MYVTIAISDSTPSNRFSSKGCIAAACLGQPNSPVLQGVQSGAGLGCLVAVLQEMPGPQVPLASAAGVGVQGPGQPSSPALRYLLYRVSRVLLVMCHEGAPQEGPSLQERPAAGAVVQHLLGLPEA